MNSPLHFFRRKADRVSQWVVIGALAQLLSVGVVVLHGQDHAQDVINQKTTDEIEGLNRRLDALDHLSIPERLRVLEELPKQMDKLQQLNTAIFVGLALNLVATIVQIRTQTSRRGERH